MSDIAKCDGDAGYHGKCPLAEHCKRYTSKPSQWQSWILAPWDGANCSLYLPSDGLQSFDDERPWEMKT